MNPSKVVRVGAVQAEPAWLDLSGSVAKTIRLIEEAASDGVQVLGFPEVFIPGYPCKIPLVTLTCLVLILIAKQIAYNLLE